MVEQQHLTVGGLVFEFAVDSLKPLVYLVVVWQSAFANHSAHGVLEVEQRVLHAFVFF